MCMRDNRTKQFTAIIYYTILVNNTVNPTVPAKMIILICIWLLFNSSNHAVRTKMELNYAASTSSYWMWSRKVKFQIVTCESSKFLLNGLNFIASLERMGAFSPNKTGTRFAQGPVWTALLSWISASFILR